MKFNNFKRGIFSVLFLALILSFTSLATISCATAKEEQVEIPETKIIEHPERMFWEVKRGETSIFVLGTIHLADKNFYPIEENILKAFDEADELYSEIGGLPEIQKANISMKKRMLKAINTEAEKHLSNFLSEEELQVIYNELGEMQSKALLSCDPWLLALVLPQVIYQKAGMDPNYGIDLYLMARAKEKEIKALESYELQFDILSSGTFEEQLRQLYEAIYSIKNYTQTAEEMAELKQAYMENDKKALGKLLTSRTEIEKGMNESEYKAFMQKLITDRNKAWAKTFNEILADGKTKKTLFVFAGSGHFIGKDSVFEILLKMSKNQ